MGEDLWYGGVTTPTLGRRWCAPEFVEPNSLGSGAWHQGAPVAELGCPAEFQREVCDLVEEGRSIGELAHDLGIGEESTHTWRGQDRIGRGLVPGLMSTEKAGLAAAKKCIADLEPSSP